MLPHGYEYPLSVITSLTIRPSIVSPAKPMVTCFLLLWKTVDPINNVKMHIAIMIQAFIGIKFFKSKSPFLGISMFTVSTPMQICNFLTSSQEMGINILYLKSLTRQYLVFQLKHLKDLFFSVILILIMIKQWGFRS